ncbi:MULTISPECIES: tetratricopeptide repeat protein [Anaerolinea]|uniref:tetratricopeptide repeat protein n=1 Tax=Anaerolinea TaxID=233189 RepID=UPI0026319558|nr:tetratricopeptide repeat protein [Anaerolinea thermophila]
MLKWVQRNPIGTFLFFLFLALMISGVLPQAVRVNRAGMEVLHTLVQKDPQALKHFSVQWADSSSQDCRLLWLSAVSTVSSQGALLSHEVLLRAIRCQPGYLEVLRGLAPYDVSLAEEVVRLYPRNPSALMWLAEVKERFDRVQATELYEIVTRVDPKNGLAWCRLGAQRQNQGDLDRALTAFQECCVHGDPGSNGCWRAGGILEQQGHLEEAIFWYNQSRFSSALKRAQDLQQRISAPGQD